MGRGRVLLGLLVGLVVLAAGGVFAANAWISGSGLKTSLERTLGDRLGRKVTIAGGLRLSLWPILGVEATDLHIANAPGFRAPELLSAAALDVAVDPAAALAGRIEVTRLRLDRPWLRLEKSADGAVNWKLGPARPEAPARTPAALKLQALSITGGRLELSDANGTRAVSDANLTVGLSSLDHPLIVKGDLNWRSRPVALVATFVRPRDTLNGLAAPVALQLNSPFIAARLDGAWDPKPGLLTGRLDASGPSLRQLSQWAGKPMGPGAGFGAFSVSGQVVRDAASLKLTGARLAVDHLRATGDLALATGAARPSVTGALAFADLDLNPYLGPEEAPSSGWSVKPVSLKGLSGLDADLAVTSPRVVWRKLQAGNVAGRVKLSGGRLDVALSRFGIYGGAGSGMISAAPASRGAAVAARLNLSGFQAQSLLQAWAGLDRVSGTGRIDLSVAGAGASQAEIMRSLSGQASVGVADGSLRGVDLAAVSHQITSALGGAVGPQARTAFSSLTGSFALAGGVANTANLVLVSPAVGLTGAGRIDLGGRSLDLVFKPTGQARFGSRSLNLSSVPFRVSGPWSKLSFAPDLKGLAEAQLKAQIGKALLGGKGGEAGDLLGQLLGGSKDTTQPDAGGQGDKKPEKKKAPDLSDLFRRVR